MKVILTLDDIITIIAIIAILVLIIGVVVYGFKYFRKNQKT